MKSFQNNFPTLFPHEDTNNSHQSCSSLNGTNEEMFAVSSLHTGVFNYQCT